MSEPDDVPGKAPWDPCARCGRRRDRHRHKFVEEVGGVLTERIRVLTVERDEARALVQATAEAAFYFSGSRNGALPPLPDFVGALYERATAAEAMVAADVEERKRILELLRPYVDHHGPAADHHPDECPGHWPPGTPWGTRDAAKPCDACKLDNDANEALALLEYRAK